MMLCPFMMIAHAAAADGRYSTECIGSVCRLWDPGIYEKYEAGCGLVPRENRRV